ncbi:MAG: hypothetical protein SNJ29_15390 [Rikenellaceae bacterium]
MDDFLLIHHDKEFLKNCQLLIEQYLAKELHLELNPKTEILRLKSGVEFLGWKCYLSDTGKVVRKLKRQSKLRVKRGVNKLIDRYNEGEIELDKVGQVLASYNGHLRHGDTYVLRKKLYQDMKLERKQ